jgi:hypothetical protein
MHFSKLTVNHSVPPAHLPSVPILKLNCFVYGDDPRNVFPVKIASTETVGTLKKVIRGETPAFDGFATDTLSLWKVSIAVDDKLKDTVSKVELREGEELSPVDRLSQIFAVYPEDRHLHIIVHSPPASKCISQGA